VVGALNTCEQELREKAYAVVMTNRYGGPERMIDLVMSRLSGPAIDLEDVAPFEERKAIVHGYSRIAGYSAKQCARQPVSRMCSPLHGTEVAELPDARQDLVPIVSFRHPRAKARKRSQ
jgi:hypothetical protein